jgi:hypothetical protein
MDLQYPVCAKDNTVRTLNAFRWRGFLSVVGIERKIVVNKEITIAK